MKANSENKHLKKSLNAYYNEVGQLLPFSGAKKRSFMANLKNKIGDYLEENPSASFEDVRDRFGSPADIIESDIDIDTYSSVAVKSNKRLKLGIALAICLGVMSVLFCFLAILFHDQAITSQGYFSESVITEISASDSDANYKTIETATVNFTIM